MTFKRPKGQWDGVAIATLVLLAFSFVFGGASRANALRLALVELAALPLLVLALTQLIRQRADALNRPLAFGLVVALVALPLAQLIPLPSGLWPLLPGRDDLKLALDIVGVAPGWSPLSLTPVDTWNSLLALIPPVALFVALVIGRRGGLARWSLLIFLGFALINLTLGALQLSTGSRVFYPYESTASGFVTGLFANRNHFAILVLSTMPFGAALAGSATARRPDQFNMYAALFAGGTVAAMLVQLAIQSRAGVVLFIPALLLSLSIAWAAARLRLPKMPVLIGCGVVLAAALGVGATFLPPVLDRFDRAEGQTEARLNRWPVVVEAGQAYLPVGSGIGSFDPVFRTVEPLNQLDSTFFNQAHNEYLQIWMEAGWIGVALIGLFLFWFVKRSWDAWFISRDSDRFLRRAASAVILLVLIHSGVDYPLRTTAIAVLFALAAAILEGVGEISPGRSGRRRRSA